MPFGWLVSQVMSLCAAPVGFASALLALGFATRGMAEPPIPVRQYLGLALWLAAPLGLLGLAALFYGADRYPRPGFPHGTLFTVLAAGVALGFTWHVWRERRQWWISAPVWAIGLFFLACSWFVGAMAIADDWI